MKKATYKNQVSDYFFEGGNVARNKNSGLGKTILICAATAAIAAGATLAYLGYLDLLEEETVRSNTNKRKSAIDRSSKSRRDPEAYYVSEDYCEIDDEFACDDEDFVSPGARS